MEKIIWAASCTCHGASCSCNYLYNDKEKQNADTETT